jgi:4-aminobutyrate aminotransferase-like enzyme
VVDYIEEHSLPANCEETGAYLRERLLELQERHAIIGEVRGMGLLQAIELVEDRQTKAPATAATLLAMEAARDQGLLLGKGGMYGNVLRFSPPMNIGRADVDNFCAMLDKALAAAGGVG